MKKALYIRTAKTGSSSIANWCKSFGHDIPFTNNVKSLSEDSKNVELLNYHFKEDHYLFYSVRNPYERAVSCWQQCIQSKWMPSSFSFEKFLDLNFKSNISEHMFTHIIPLTDYLGPWIDKVKFVIRLENFENCMRRLSEELETPYKDPGHHYPGRYNHSHNYLTPENKKKIEEKYKADFEFFSY